MKQWKRLGISSIIIHRKRQKLWAWPPQLEESRDLPITTRKAIVQRKSALHHRAEPSSDAKRRAVRAPRNCKHHHSPEAARVSSFTPVVGEARTLSITKSARKCKVVALHPWSSGSMILDIGVWVWIVSVHPGRMIETAPPRVEIVRILISLFQDFTLSFFLSICFLEISKLFFYRGIITDNWKKWFGLIFPLNQKFLSRRLNIWDWLFLIMEQSNFPWNCWISNSRLNH